MVKLFRTIAPEFSELTDEEVLTYIDLYKAFVSQKAFGKMYYKALCYFVAHMLTIVGLSEEQGADSSYFTAGNVTMEKEGDLQRSYANVSSSSSSADDLLNKTFYGKMFLQIRAMCVMTAMTRMGC